MAVTMEDVRDLVLDARRMDARRMALPEKVAAEHVGDDRGDT